MPRKQNSVHYQSGQDEGGTTEHGTPQGLFDLLGGEFHFTLDPAASKENAKTKKFYDRERDGLAQSWANETVFLNPPYGRGEEGVVPWLRKVTWEVSNPSRSAPTIVMLLPARTSESWWYEYVAQCANEVRFIVGRLQFEGAENVASFPSAIAVYRPRHNAPLAILHTYLVLTPVQRGVQTAQPEQAKKRREPVAPVASPSPAPPVEMPVDDSHKSFGQLQQEAKEKFAAGFSPRMREQILATLKPGQMLTDDGRVVDVESGEVIEIEVTEEEETS
jgi:site-specific DNA-methyltransferase (adenine-specific)